MVVHGRLSQGHSDYQVFGPDQAGDQEKGESWSLRFCNRSGFSVQRLWVSRYVGMVVVNSAEKNPNGCIKYESVDGLCKEVC